jgi:hypothetical protein
MIKCASLIETTTNENSKNNMKTKVTKSYDHPGRPAYIPVIPRGRFTMNDLCEENGVSLKTGKGKLCSRLTLVKWVAKQLGNKRSGLIVKVKDETSEPNSRKGLGRKAFLYIRRTMKDGLKTAAKSNVAVKMNTTADYEKVKADLLGTSVPAVTVTPETPAPVAPAPVTETATVAAPEPVGATAPVAPEVPAAAPVTA